MQKQEKKILEGHRSTFCIKVPFGIGHPHLHIKCSLYVCSRVQGSQIFKQNSIILICSKIIAFLVILLSSCGPHIISVVPMLSPCPMSLPHCPHLPHIIPIAPRRSPCGPHGCGLRCLHPMLSPSSPHHPNHSHVIPTSSPCCLEGPHIIPNPPDTYSTHSLTCWGWGPWIIKNAIRFELINIFLILFEDLKSVETSPPMGGCMDGGWVGGWVGQWVGPGQIIKNWINLDLIEIIQFCLKIYVCWDTPSYGWLGGWVG